MPSNRPPPPASLRIEDIVDALVILGGALVVEGDEALIVDRFLLGVQRVTGGEFFEDIVNTGKLDKGYSAPHPIREPELIPL